MSLAFLGGAVLMAQQSASAPATQPTSQPTTQSKAKDAAARKEEEMARVMDFFKITQPDVYEQALTLKASDPARFEKLIHGAVGMVNKLEDMRKRNPKLFDLRMKEIEADYKSVRMAKELKRTDLTPADHDRMLKELSDQVAVDFELAQKCRQQEIEDLTQKLAELSKQIEEREQTKDDLIRKRVDDLIENPPHTDW